MAAHNDYADLYNRKEVFIIMHHIESYDSPEPLSSNGYNVTRTVYVYNSRECANKHAQQYAMDRKLMAQIDDADTTQSEWHDHNNANLGYGWELLIRERGFAPRLARKVVSRELIWVEPQWMHTSL